MLDGAEYEYGGLQMMHLLLPASVVVGQSTGNSGAALRTIAKALTILGKLKWQLKRERVLEISRYPMQGLSRNQELNESPLPACVEWVGKRRTGDFVHIPEK